MDVRAAVAFEAGKPLSIETVQLDGPREGEVLVEVKATGICHTDEFTLSGGDPEGIFPSILGHEGAGVVVDVGPGVTSLKKGRSRDPPLHPGMPDMRILPQSQDQSLPSHSGDPGARPHAGRQQPLLPERREDLPLHGLLHLRQLHRAARNRPCQGPRGRPLRQDLLHRLRRHHRRRCRHQHRQGRAWLQCRGLRSGRHRPQRDSRRASGGCRHDRRRRPQRRQAGPWPRSSA